MNPRLRPAVAAVGVLVFLGFYVWAVLAIGEHVPDAPWIKVLYLGLAGVLWGVPILPLITWAERGGRPRR